MIPWRNFRRFFEKTLKQPGYAFLIGLKRLKAYYFYQFGNGKSGIPESLTFFLTRKCNLRCKMCGQWGEGGITKSQDKGKITEELSLERFREIIDELGKFKPSITLFGGEPLLFSRVVELIKYIKDKGLHCVLITNGFLLESLAQDIVESGLDELNVSLDAQGQLHDEIRGMPGLFDVIMSGLKKVEYYKKLKRKHHPIVNLQCTISKFNYLSIDRMLAVAKESGADSLTFHNLIFLSNDVIEKQKKIDELLNCSSIDWSGFIFEPGIDASILSEKIKEIQSVKHKFSVDFYPNFSRTELTNYYENPCYFPTGFNAKCLSPWLVAYVFPDGEVRPCLNCNYSYGNLKNEKFLNLWNCKSAIRYRKLLKEKSIFPVCSRCTELYRY